MGKRLKNAPAVAHGPFHHAPINEEKKHGGGMGQTHATPVFRSTEVVLKVKSDVAGSLTKERGQMLVVAMGPIMGKPAGPGLTQFGCQWFNHGFMIPRVGGGISSLHSSLRSSFYYLMILTPTSPGVKLQRHDGRACLKTGSTFGR